MAHIIETEETLIIETPERVPLAFALASIGNRFLAVLIDHFIQYMSILVVAWAFLSWSGVGDRSLPNSEMLGQMSKWTIALMILFLFLIFLRFQDLLFSC